MSREAPSYFDDARDSDEETLDSDYDEESVEDIDSQDSENDNKFDLELNLEENEAAPQDEMPEETKIDEEDDFEVVEENNNYLQKFTLNISETYLQDNHPECVIHNNVEIDALSSVVRDSDGTIIDMNHQTLPILTKYERTRVLGERAKQINSGAKPYIDVLESIIDGYLIADEELREKKIPFIIQRPLPNGAKEFWKLADLEIIE